MGRTDLPADSLFEPRVTAYLEGRLRALGASPVRQNVLPGRDNLISVYEPPGAPENRLAYKTGTSYGHRDAWAIGFDGAHVVGVWMGRPDGSPRGSANHNRQIDVIDHSLSPAI